jgi:hypothetical protein|tara:strand:+ start:274 stop:477 length:204 start_codon:yes stop_codon:yes gene_type:complete
VATVVVPTAWEVVVAMEWEVVVAMEWEVVVAGEVRISVVVLGTSGPPSNITLGLARNGPLTSQVTPT